MDSEHDILLVAVEQRKPVLLGRIEGAVKVVGIEYEGEEAESARQRHHLDPAQELPLLQVQRRIGEFLDRAHVVEMGVREEDIGDVGSVDAQLGHQAHRRDPVGNSEFLGDGDAVALLHEAAIHEDVALAAARQHEGEGKVDRSLVVGALYQRRHRLILAAGVFEDEDLPDPSGLRLLAIGQFVLPRAVLAAAVTS